MEDLNTESLPHHSAEARKPSVRDLLRGGSLSIPLRVDERPDLIANRRAAMDHHKQVTVSLHGLLPRRADYREITVACRESTLSAAILVTSLALLRCSGIRGQGVASDRGNLRGIHACCSIRTPDRPGGSPRRMRGARRFRGACSLCRPAGKTTARSRSTMWCSTTIRITSLTLAASFRSTSTASIRVTSCQRDFQVASAHRRSPGPIGGRGVHWRG